MDMDMSNSLFNCFSAIFISCVDIFIIGPMALNIGSNGMGNISGDVYLSKTSYAM